MYNIIVQNLIKVIKFNKKVLNQPKSRKKIKGTSIFCLNNVKNANTCLRRVHLIFFNRIASHFVIQSLFLKLIINIIEIDEYFN